MQIGHPINSSLSRRRKILYIHTRAVSRRPRPRGRQSNWPQSRGPAAAYSRNSPSSHNRPKGGERKKESRPRALVRNVYTRTYTWMAVNERAGATRLGGGYIRYMYIYVCAPGVWPVNNTPERKRRWLSASFSYFYYSCAVQCLRPSARVGIICIHVHRECSHSEGDNNLCAVYIYIDMRSTAIFWLHIPIWSVTFLEQRTLLYTRKRN